MCRNFDSNFCNLSSNLLDFWQFSSNFLALVSNVPAFSEHKPDWPNNGFVCVYELKQVLLFHCLCKLENQPYTSILTTRTASLRIHP